MTTQRDAFRDIYSACRHARRFARKSWANMLNTDLVNEYLFRAALDTGHDVPHNVINLAIDATIRGTK